MRRLSLQIQQPSFCKSWERCHKAREVRGLRHSGVHQTRDPSDETATNYEAENWRYRESVPTFSCHGKKKNSHQDASININIFAALLEQME